jgi:hypothetical protein
MKFGRLFMPVRYDPNGTFEQMNPRWARWIEDGKRRGNLGGRYGPG